LDLLDTLCGERLIPQLHEFEYPPTYH
jgi:hypothetical protein